MKNIRLSGKSAFGIFLVLFIILSFENTTLTQDKPLTYQQIITALNSKLPNSVFKNKSQVLAYLVSAVEKRGVEKPLSPEIEELLRETGATDQLIQAIRANSPDSTVSGGINTLPPKSMTNSIGMEFVLIPRGSFMMGTPKSYRNNESDLLGTPIHKVTINYEFYLGKYEVTQEEYEKVMGHNPSGFPGCPRCPVETVSWDDAQAYIARLNARNDGYVYRLPSEAEWEYAARAGTTTRWSFGDNAENVADLAWWYNTQTTQPVGQKPANAFGLYDMHGNVTEYCEDIFVESYQGLKADGSPNVSSGDPKRRVDRGGCWTLGPQQGRSGIRSYSYVDSKSYCAGFRLAATAK